MEKTGLGPYEHVVGVAKGVSEDILADLRANFEGECSEVGMYLAMARVAHREGYPEIGLYWEKAAYEEAEHAAKFAGFPSVKLFGTQENVEIKSKVTFGVAEGDWTLQREQKLQILMQSTIQFMRWLEMRQDMERPLRDFLRDTLVNSNSRDLIHPSLEMIKE